MKFNLKYILLFLTLSLLFDSCIIVKHEDRSDSVPVVSLSPKPSVTMSDVLVRSKKGDMIAFLPQDWFFIDVEDKASSDIFALAVNPDYTLAAVFSVIRKSDRIDSLIAREGLLGLARLSYDRHERKTASALKQLGKYSPVQMGVAAFVEYTYSPSGASLISRSAVFMSSIRQYYEISLVPMNITGKPLPTDTEANSIFRSIMATVQY